MQRGRLGSTSAGPEEAEDGLCVCVGNISDEKSFRLIVHFIHQSGMLLVWQVSKLRIQLHGRSIKRNRRMISDGKDKLISGEEALKKGELEADKDRMMIEYRAQLDAERARKLARGSNYSSSKGSHKKDKKDRDSRKHSSRKRKLLMLVEVIGNKKFAPLCAVTLPHYISFAYATMSINNQLSNSVFHGFFPLLACKNLSCQTSHIWTFFSSGGGGSLAAPHAFPPTILSPNTTPVVQA
ncbi:hypothetical protein SASPL_133727 [Salvia splendens]|uniref:Uncharacterized protein n=1 Tax=Salvia splendens TaxID=180675 RepID=A0A8X8X4R1_SALSN|nr:hypothetical protein SASPL_133727 [Salvia splendens]